MSPPISNAVRAARLAALLGLAGCRQLTGADTFSIASGGAGAAADGAAPSSVFAWESASCFACTERVCPTELAACNASEICRGFDACYGSHPTPAQRARCSATNPDGAPEYFVLGRCIALTCGDDCGGGESYECLGEPFDAVSPQRESFQYTTNYQDLLTHDPLPGLTITGCERLGWTDLDCQAGNVGQAVTDDTGTATLELAFPRLGVKQPWDGYLIVSGPGELPDLRYANFGFATDTFFRFSMMTTVEYSLITSRYKVPTLPDHGTLVLDIFDCGEFPARGVAVEIEPSAPEVRRFYSSGDLALDETATETGKDSFAIFANVPVGLLTVHATVALTGARLADVEVPIRADTRTVVTIEPKTAP